MNHPALLDEFLHFAQTKLDQNLRQITRCTALLNPQDLWLRPNPHTNSVANLILHLTGNVRQWIVAGIGGQPFQRNRPAEFADRNPRPAAEILPPLQQTVYAACAVLAGLDAPALEIRRSIQAYEVSTLVAIAHVVEHFSFHTGQIVHITKTLKNVDLSLYDDQGHKLTPADPNP